MYTILGISAFYHDASACLIMDGKIMAAAQEERFNRRKHSPDFPINAIKYCLNSQGLTIDDLDAVVFYEKPFLKFERLLQTYYSFAPKGIFSFLKAIPAWLDEKLFLKQKIKKLLYEIEAFDKKKLTLLFSGHHLSHAASAYYPSPFLDAAILTIDGVGEWSTASISKARNGKIENIKEMLFPHSVGLLYSAFTYFLGFTVNSGEYKLMGLSPFGDIDAPETKGYIEKIKREIVSIKEDGSIWLNQNYFDYATGLKMIHTKKWERLFDISKRKAESDIIQQHCNLARAIQEVLEEIVLKMAQEAKRLTHSDNLCLAGGVALNCVSNAKLHKLDIFKQIYIQPAAGDCGGSIGATLAVHHMYFENDKITNIDNTEIYLGPEFDEKEIIKLNRSYKTTYTKYEDFSALTEIVARLIGDGKVVGWFQDRMEFGPRALGNRSILADPRCKDMQFVVNKKVKLREGFRPFAPAVLEEDSFEFFELESLSPYMLYTAKIKQLFRYNLPENFKELTIPQRVAYKKSIFPAVTHVDYSARVQTVSRVSNPKFWQLLNELKKQTGYPMVLNTSFNMRGEPIVCTPTEAFCCFMNTDIDVLVIQDYIYFKDEQANSLLVKKRDFKLD